MVKDIHAHLGLGTHKEERKLLGRLRANKEVDRIEGVEIRGRKEVKELKGRDRPTPMLLQQRDNHLPPHHKHPGNPWLSEETQRR